MRKLFRNCPEDGERDTGSPELGSAAPGLAAGSAQQRPGPAASAAGPAAHAAAVPGQEALCFPGGFSQLSSRHEPRRDSLLGKGLF